MNILFMLKRHEGFRAKPYTDTVGKLSIGYGRNLSDVGVSEEEALFLLLNDVTTAEHELYKSYKWTVLLDEPRRDVLINMMFNLGATKFGEFTRMLAALEARDFAMAATEMMDSQWATQVKGRANELAQMMITGQYPKEA